MSVSEPAMELLLIKLWNSEFRQFKARERRQKLKYLMDLGMALDWEKERWQKAGWIMRLHFGKNRQMKTRKGNDFMKQITLNN